MRTFRNWFGIVMPSSAPTKLLRFNLRVLMLLTACSCILLAMKARQVESQKEAVAAILEAGLCGTCSRRICL